MAVSNSRRIAILGKTGVGKSSLANTIFGEQQFNVGHSFNSTTKTCQSVTKPVNGGNITLIDTPGLFDTDRPEEMKSKILRSVTEFAPGPHAFIIVLKVEKFTDQEQAVIAQLNKFFSDEFFQYAIVLFTHGDQLPEGETIEKCVGENKLVSDLVKKCGGRCHVIDNTNWKNNPQDEYRNNQVQVKKLLKTIDEMVEANKGAYYTNEMLQEVERRVIQEVQRMRPSPGNMSEEEINQKAKNNVLLGLGVGLACVSVGVVLGGFFGPVASIKVAIALLVRGVDLVPNVNV